MSDELTERASKLFGGGYDEDNYLVSKFPKEQIPCQFDPIKILADPEKFQIKGGGDAHQGSTGRLSADPKLRTPPKDGDDQEPADGRGLFAPPQLV